MNEGQGIDHLRCADTDRELVAEVLNAAYADGRLSFEEHADRIALAYDAKTYQELNTLTTDLIATNPGQTPSYGATSAAQAGPQTWSSSLESTGNPRVPNISRTTSDGFRGGSAHLSSLRPGKITLLEPHVKLSTVMGDVHLDLIGTTFSQQEIQIDVTDIMAEIKIRVPEGVTVRTDGVNVVLGEVTVRGLVPAPHGVTLNIGGLVAMGDIKVFGPDMDERKYRKFIK
ncbi:MAG: DUF1707 domain-containing protein [Tessaracoccus sp.]